MTDDIAQAIQDFETAVEEACQGESENVDSTHAKLFSAIEQAIKDARYGYCQECPPVKPCEPCDPCPTKKGFLDYWREFWSH